MPHATIELWLMALVGSLAGAWALLDSAMHLLLSNNLLKGVPFATAILLLWAAPRAERQEEERQSVLAILLATMLALVMARVVQNGFESPRPLMVPELAAMYPPSFHEYRLDLNSFPSDHMALYMTIALGVYQLRRRLGIVLMAWAVGGVGFSRLYAGYHYPVDILGGMAIAAVSLALVSKTRVWLHPLLRKVAQLAARYPAGAIATMFFLCFQIATVFDTIREIGEFGRVGVRLVLTAVLQ